MIKSRIKAIGAFKYIHSKIEAVDSDEVVS